MFLQLHTTNSFEQTKLSFFKQTFPLYFELIKYLLSSLSKSITQIKINNYELILYTTKTQLLTLLLFLQKHTFCKFLILTDILVTDYPGNSHRFLVQYQLLSVAFNFRLRVALWTDELSSIPSICSLFPGANWYEREAWDMFGIFFENHPDLRRILTDYGFKGHPLRKDFPLTGYHEVFYDDTKKGLVYVPVSLAQDFRNFSYKNPWISAS